VPNNELHNAGTRSAYQAGLYDGFTRVDDLVRYGDFGLGALDGNDGELIVLDGICYRTAANGATAVLDGASLTPYATVTTFRPTHSFQVDQELERKDLELRCDERLHVANRIFAIRIRGDFQLMRAGASVRQHVPYRPLAEVFPEYAFEELSPVSGTLVGFRCPPFLKGIDFVGYHFHFLSDDGEHGGHVDTFTVRDVQIDAMEISAYDVSLPREGPFFELDLSPFH
jgi:acetolactate decarboxylase